MFEDKASVSFETTSNRPGGKSWRGHVTEILHYVQVALFQGKAKLLDHDLQLPI